MGRNLVTICSATPGRPKKCTCYANLAAHDKTAHPRLLRHQSPSKPPLYSQHSIKQTTPTLGLAVVGVTNPSTRRATTFESIKCAAYASCPALLLANFRSPRISNKLKEEDPESVQAQARLYGAKVVQSVPRQA